jgi:hypothetical protein
MWDRNRFCWHHIDLNNIWLRSSWHHDLTNSRHANNPEGNVYVGKASAAPLERGVDVIRNTTILQIWKIFYGYVNPEPLLQLMC